MTTIEKIEQGMRLIVEGCKDVKHCNDCPFVKFCDVTPEHWFAEEDEIPDEDWGYNEDMGFDAYEGCYTWDC